ncbi:DUF4652 domain-containing protein [Vallitalea guaymasensis]|uniref:DUF4652 domain-containing protein n=1 Tax=Vallitalea guaymasensis TaxID=1185412 RepID=A0A8J8M747_9FIRM|nr:DUF4652 domain-containing protein [Vallitalea guaymasensis]QUH27448.1 DUF4652 domain-containing protein [Vallitalea guaymasensis]
MKYIKISIFLMTLIVATGCSKEVIKIEEDVYKKSQQILPDDTYKMSDINEDISLVYGESKTIYIKEDNEYIEVGKTLCSYPKIAPNESSIVFVTGEPDYPGELYLYNLKDHEKTMLLGNDEGSNTPKDVEWLDNKRLLVIRGFGHGTVRLGGEICIYNIETKEVTPLLLPDELSEYRSVNKKDDTYEIEYATWEDETLNKTNSKIMIYKISEIEKLADK